MENQALTTSFYDIKINKIDGKPLNLNDFEGKKVLIVNVASECGFTQQYTQLQELHETFGKELAIIGVPSNDFGGQEPGTENEIAQFCSLNYGVSFTMTEKVNILNETHELYKWLTMKTMNGVNDFEVRWNFHKFLISESGQLALSLPSNITPLDSQIIDWINR